MNWLRRLSRRGAEPPQNRELIAALQEGHQPSQSDRAPLFRAVLNSTLLVPLSEPLSAEAGATRNVAVLEREGVRAVAGFTDLEALRRFQPGEPAWAPMPAVELCRLALQRECDHVLLNAAGPVGYELSRLEFQSLVEGLLPLGENRVETQTQTSIQIGMPAERPPDSVLAVMRAAVVVPEIREVYWFWMAVAGVQPHLGLAVSPSSDQNCDRVGRAIEPIWQKHRPANSLVTVVGLDQEPFAHAVRQKGELLYRAADR
jgi:hypothetical protein